MTTDAPWRDRMGKPSEEAAMIADLDPRARRAVRFVLDEVRRAGHAVLLAYTRRGDELTRRLAASGTGLAQGSKHPLGLAADIVALHGWWEGEDADALWPAIGRAVDAWNAKHPHDLLEWGGTWSDPWDPAHIEYVERR